MTQSRLTAVVNGEVQGVGFRYWVRRQADQLGLSGTAVNEADGSVTVIAEGPRHAVGTLLDTLRSGDTPGRVRTVDGKFSDPTGEFAHFRER